jgi:predicted aspartyl protease
MVAMGRIVASVTVHNARALEKGFRFDALVDTGAPYLTLPAAWKDRLGELEVVRTVQCETATQELVEAEVCGPVKIQIEGFPPIYSEAVFLPMQPSDGVYDPLVGHLVLQQSQAGVDMVTHRLFHIKSVDLKRFVLVNGLRTCISTPPGSALDHSKCW